MKLTLALEKRYNEIMQTSFSTFAFVVQKGPEEFEQLFYPVRCRDFLGDVVEAHHYNETVNIYGFIYDPKKQQIDTDHTKLSVTFKRVPYDITKRDPQHELISWNENIHILHAIEEKNGLELTQVLKVDDVTLITIGDKFWQSSVWSLSLYTYLLRSLGAPVEPFSKAFMVLPGNWANGYYNVVGVDGFAKLVNNLKKIRGEYNTATGWEDHSMSRTHNYSGFVSLFKPGIVAAGNLFTAEFKEI